MEYQTALPVLQIGSSYVNLLSIDSIQLRPDGNYDLLLRTGAPLKISKATVETVIKPRLIVLNS